MKAHSTNTPRDYEADWGQEVWLERGDGGHPMDGLVERLEELELGSVCLDF